MADDDFLQDNEPYNEEGDINPAEEMKEASRLPEDNDPPFSSPSGIQDRVDYTQPETDSNVDPHELYDEGIESASEADPPSPTKTNEYEPISPDTIAGGVPEQDKMQEKDEEDESI